MFTSNYKYKSLKIISLKKWGSINIIIFGYLFLSTGCSREIEINGFDQIAWQQDVRSCKNVRPTLIPSLKKAIPQLIGLNHNEIINVLGKPEGNSLEKSGERVYYYFVQPGEQCNYENIPKANKVLVRFDALDRVYKVRLEDGF